MMHLNFNPFPVIVTERLVLRQVGIEDATEVHVLRSDERIMHFLNRDPDRTLEDTIHKIKQIQQLQENNEAILWGITLKTDDRSSLIGTIGYWHIVPEHYRAEIGYILHPDHWKKGIMKEALQALITYGFEKMKLHSIEANINPGNKPSGALLESCGFVKEAYHKENYHHNGVFYDSVIYAKLNN